jgi:hypothetical protein
MIDSTELARYIERGLAKQIYKRSTIPDSVLTKSVYRTLIFNPNTVYIFSFDDQHVKGTCNEGGKLFINGEYVYTVCRQLGRNNDKYSIINVLTFEAYEVTEIYTYTSPLRQVVQYGISDLYLRGIIIDERDVLAEVIQGRLTRILYMREFEIGTLYYLEDSYSQQGESTFKLCRCITLSSGDDNSTVYLTNQYDGEVYWLQPYVDDIGETNLFSVNRQRVGRAVYKDNIRV